MAAAEKLSDSYVVIGVKEKVGYGLGDFASNLSFGFVSLTDVRHLGAQLAGSMNVMGMILRYCRVSAATNARDAFVEGGGVSGVSHVVKCKN